jgi:hypothetical protein
LLRPSRQLWVEQSRAQHSREGSASCCSATAASSPSLSNLPAYLRPQSSWQPHHFSPSSQQHRRSVGKYPPPATKKNEDVRCARVRRRGRVSRLRAGGPARVAVPRRHLQLARLARRHVLRRRRVARRHGLPAAGRCGHRRLPRLPAVLERQRLCGPRGRRVHDRQRRHVGLRAAVRRLRHGHHALPRDVAARHPVPSNVAA